ncbi:MAG TPA: LCP family protein [Anaerolineales bacterium]|nr:LCP family protein [Anaerolineales bacterium]
MSVRTRRTVSYLVWGMGTFVLCCMIVSFGFAGYKLFTPANQQSTATLPPPFVIVEITATPPAAEAKAPQCGGPEVMYILLAGSDTRSNSYTTGLADAIRIVRVDFVNPGITMMSFHRDLYVEIPGIADHHGITHGKLNQAYLYGTDTFQYYDGPDEGLGLLALTLEHNFGVQVDHAAAVNLQTFVKVIDAIGGIDIDLPNAVDGRTSSNNPDLYFPAGEQHLDGYHTMLLARLRPEGDLVRSRTQDLILKALAVKLLEPATLLQIPAIIDAFKGSIQTNLTQTEITQLLCLAALIDPQSIQTHSFPDELFKLKRVNDPIIGNTSILDADFEILKAYVQEFNKGSWPETIPQP